MLLDVCQELDTARHISDPLWERLSAYFTPEQILDTGEYIVKDGVWQL